MNTRRFTAFMAGVACIVGAFAAGCNNDTPDDAASPGTEAGGTMSASPGAGGSMSASPGAGGAMSASPGASGGTTAPPGPAAK